MKLFILKLGGSLITDKSLAYTAKPEVISRIVTEIKHAFDQSDDFHLILGNGAGSFAHQSAKQYDTINGFSEKRGAYGACLVHADALTLHMLILKECLKQQLPVYSFQPSAMMVSPEAQNEPFYKAVDVALQKNLIPFVYGDVILDTAQGSTIFSTDKLFSLFALHFQKKQLYEKISIIHAGNYDGVLDNANTVIPKISVHNVDEIEPFLKPTAHIDVTGGMSTKVQSALELAKQNIDSLVIHGDHKESITRALLGKNIHGTLICK